MRSLARWLLRHDTLLVLWIAIGVGCFLQADRPLSIPDEPREAGIAREMLDHGNFVVPTLDHEAFLEKPPLTADAMAIAFWLCGPTPLSARLFATLCGIAAAIFVCAAGQMWLGRRTGIAAGLVLATMAIVVTTTHRAVTDPPVLAASAFAIWALASGHPGPRRDRGAPKLRRWRLGVGAGMGVMFLGKGLLGPAGGAVRGGPGGIADPRGDATGVRRL
jgi:4-amino-4-deoxy-L-arabinose transferase-like glycosyltransferase